MGRNVLQPDAFTAVSYHVPYEVLRDALAPYFSSFGDGTKDLSLRDSSRSNPPIQCSFHPMRNRHRANPSSLSDQVHDGPVVLADLDLVCLQPDKLGSTKTAAQSTASIA
jgi:hypothetical protein